MPFWKSVGKTIPPIHRRMRTKRRSETWDYQVQNVGRWFEKRFGTVAAEIGNHHRDPGGKEGTGYGIYTVKHESPVRIPIRIAIGECEIRQLRRWQWARVPPAATPTRIYLIFPFYLFELPLVEGHSSNPHGSVAIIGEHGGPPRAQLPAGLPSRSRATILHLRIHRCVREHARTHARHRCRCLSGIQQCSFDSHMLSLSVCTVIRRSR